MRYSVRQLAVLGMLGAVLIAVQVALAALPNIELVSLLIIIYAISLGKKVFAPVFVFILAQGLIYGFGIWWASYLYVWPLLAILALMLRHSHNRMAFVILSGAFGLFFGALCAIPYLITGGFSLALAYFIKGIPFDLLHCIGNTLIALFLFKPLTALMRKLDCAG